ncbi:MAG: peptidylprolyl isomerase [Nostoc sp. C3-bin3]|nr:peptidylprolyl isomerase [Nostoc sp. C3-bin3]
MSNILNISQEDIIHKLKLSCQIPGVLEAVATEKIIAKAALEAEITVTPEEIQEEADRIRFEQKLVKAVDTWAWLKKYHLSLDDFETSIQTNILSRKLAHFLFANKVEHFFYQHQLDYVSAVTYEVILEDRDLALELFYALQEGEISFSEIARSYIQNPELRRAGGYQGIRHRKDFRPEIATTVFAANPPQVIKPITTQKGVYLIWVEEIIQPQLDEQMRFEIQQELFFDWLKRQIEQLEIMVQLGSDSNLQLSQ